MKIKSFGPVDDGLIRLFKKSNISVMKVSQHGIPPAQMMDIKLSEGGLVYIDINDSMFVLVDYEEATIKFKKDAPMPNSAIDTPLSVGFTEYLISDPKCFDKLLKDITKALYLRKPKKLKARVTYDK